MVTKFVTTSSGAIINLNRVTMLDVEPAGTDGDGGYRILAFDKIPRAKEYSPSVTICRVETYEAARRWLAGFAGSLNYD